MSKLTIGIVSTTVYPAPPKGYGGLERVTGHLARELDIMGHKVYLFAPTGSYIPDKSGGHLFSPGNPGTVSEEVAMKMYIMANPSLEALKECDVIHDSSWSYAPYELKNHPEQFKAKFLHTCHGMDHGWRTPPPWEKMNLVGISASHAHALQAQSGRPFRFAYNGIPIDEFPYHAAKGSRLLFLSRIYEPKGPVQAIDYAEKTGHDIDIVGGSFGDEPGFVDFVKKKCEASKHARFLGEVNNETRLRLLQDAKAVLLPIQTAIGTTLWREPMGLVSLEANAVGTPIIVGANGGWKETVRQGRTGFLCNNAADYIDAIARVGDINPEACRAWAEQFSTRVMADEYLRLYQSPDW